MNLIERDLKHIWHPCSQMKDYEAFPPLEVVSASGSELTLRGGRKIIDAISSWWCKSLGHNHPRLKRALKEQIEKFEHVLLANTTNETIVALSEKLAQLSPALGKVFYASDGSSAVEIAMKMSLHAQQLRGEQQRQIFLALENAYHGETVGAMSVSDVGIYRDPYRALMFKSHIISGLPYVSGTQDRQWNDAAEAWPQIEKQLEPFAETAAGILVEPILQGAGGMGIYSADFLKRLRGWTRQHGVYLIADEIMTGMGRTGKMLACEHAEIEPDFLCLSKGLTSGWLPMSATLMTQTIYDLFYDDYAQGKSFLHSHTYSGNVLAACVALETLNVMKEEKIVDQVNTLGDAMRLEMQKIATATGLLTNVRGIGAMAAADLVVQDSRSRVGFEIYQQAVALGALLRPLGNTIYWLPPLNMELHTLQRLSAITAQAIESSKRVY